jgi:hypothetical protein
MFQWTDHGPRIFHGNTNRLLVMKHILPYCLLCPLLALGQTRNSQMVFATNVWLDFTSDTFTWQASSYNPTLRNGCIGDPAGHFLLLADDRGVRNALFELVMDGDSASLDWTNASSAYVILPKPGNPDGYFIFRNEAGGERRGGWVEVDMSANGGLGAVIGTTTWYTSNTTSKLVATPHANGTDYWIIQHTDGSDAFEAWGVTASGIATSAVLSQAGTPFVTTTYPTTHPDFRGPMKASMSGTQLALAKMQGTSPDTILVELFDLDPWTGELIFLDRVNTTIWSYGTGSPYQSLSPLRWIGGLDFAPDDAHLYVSLWDTLATPYDGNVVAQFSLGDHSTNAMQNSGTMVTSVANNSENLLSDPDGSQLMLAPNGRIMERFISTTTNEAIFNPKIRMPTGLPRPVIPTGPPGGFDSYNLWVTQGVRGFPNPCKRYHDSEPIWLGTSPAPQAPPALAVVPNPVTDRAALHLGGREIPDELRWSDASGRVVRTSAPWRDGPTVVLDRGGLANGLYNVTASRKGRVIGHVRVLCQ